MHKCISKIKSDLAVDPAIKSVHTLWLYELLKHKNGLTSTEIAEKSNIDRSLVSRELSALMHGGYIKTEPQAGKRGYNARIRLTEKGLVTAERIAEAALEIQTSAGLGIDPAELVAFYSTLEKLSANLTGITEKQ